MMKCKLLIILLALMLIPTVTATIQCQISTDNSTWQKINNTNIGGCIDEENEMGHVQNLDCNTAYNIRCKNDTSAWGYIQVTTQRCDGELQMASLAIIIFILAIVGTLFTLPFKVRFIKNEVVNTLLQRGCWVIAIFLMVLGSAMLADIADAAGIGLQSEIFMFMWILEKTAYFFIMFIVISFMFEVVMALNNKKKARQRGEDYDDHDGA